MGERGSQESNVEKINSDERREGKEKRMNKKPRCNKRTVRKLLCEEGE